MLTPHSNSPELSSVLPAWFLNGRLSPFIQHGLMGYNNVCMFLCISYEHTKICACTHAQKISAAFPRGQVAIVLCCAGKHSFIPALVISLPRASMNTTNEITRTVILSDLISKARFGLVITGIADFKYTLEASICNLHPFCTLSWSCSLQPLSKIFLCSKYLTELLLSLKKAQ